LSLIRALNQYESAIKKTRISLTKAI